jgi:hypothetical protein
VLCHLYACLNQRPLHGDSKHAGSRKARHDYFCLPTRINPGMCARSVNRPGAVPYLLRRPQVAEGQNTPWTGTLSCTAGPAGMEGEDDAEQDAGKATEAQWFKHRDGHSRVSERATARAAESATTWSDRDAV